MVSVSVASGLASVIVTPENGVTTASEVVEVACVPVIVGATAGACVTTVNAGVDAPKPAIPDESVQLPVVTLTVAFAMSRSAWAV